MISSSSQATSTYRPRSAYHRTQRKSPSNNVSFASSSASAIAAQHQRAKLSLRSHSDGTVIESGEVGGGEAGETDNNGGDDDESKEGFFNFLRPRNLRKSITRAVRHLKSGDQG